MPLTRADPSARTLAVNADKLTVRSVITTIDPDRSGDIVIPTGMKNADDFLLNPVVLWAHQRAQFPPIGVCEWIDIQPRRIVAETRFARGVPFAEDVFRLYEQGILKGWSIGFIPRKARRLPSPDVRTPPALRVDEWDLLEYSAVPIPENPGAVTVAINKGLVRDPIFRDWLQGITEPRDVLGELIG
jgi:phage head maturation protease